MNILKFVNSLKARVLKQEPLDQFQWKSVQSKSIIPMKEYANRRSAVMQNKVEPIVLFANNSIMYSGHVKIPFKQNSSFYYLTASDLPDAIAVLVPTRFSFDYHMFITSQDPFSPPLDPPTECKIHPIAEFSNFIKKLNPKFVYTNHPPTNTLFPHSIQQRWKLYTDPIPFKPLNLDKYRVIKSTAEIECITKASELNASIMNHIMSNKYDNEHDVVVDINYLSLQYNLNLSFIPVVASGTNTVFPHYQQNNMPIHKRDPLVVDFGVTIDNYCSDMTRSWQVKETKVYQELLTKLQTIQSELIQMATIKNSIDSLEIHCKTLLHEHFPFAPIHTICPHPISHHIGLCLHDVPTISTSQKLNANNVITIEPGVYFPPSKDIPREYWGYGLRIEDVVVVNATSTILTK